MGKTGKRNGCIKKFRFYPWINHGYIYPCFTQNGFYGVWWLAIVVLFSASRFWSIDNSIINHVHLLIILLVFLQIYIINLFHRRWIYCTIRTPVGCKYWHAQRAKLQNKWHPEMIDHLCSCIAVLNTYVSIVLHDII